MSARFQVHLPDTESRPAVFARIRRQNGSPTSPLDGNPQLLANLWEITEGGSGRHRSPPIGLMTMVGDVSIGDRATRSLKHWRTPGATLTFLYSYLCAWLSRYSPLEKSVIKAITLRVRKRACTTLVPPYLHSLPSSCLLPDPSGFLSHFGWILYLLSCCP